MKYLVSLAILFFSLFVTNAWSEDHVIFVDGNGDCCAHQMHRVIEFAYDRGFNVRQVTWSDFSETRQSGTTATDEGKARFVRTGIKFLEALPRESDVYFIAHSWGAHSVLRLLREYQGRNVHFRLFASIDMVGPGGRRGNVVNLKIPRQVGYFYNRWQEISIWPSDFLRSGRHQCDHPTICNQKKRTFFKNSDGSSVTSVCGFHENCPGHRIEQKLQCRLGICTHVPVHVPGRAKKRVSHTGLPADGFIQQELIKLINGISKEEPILLPVESSDEVPLGYLPSVHHILLH